MTFGISFKIICVQSYSALDFTYKIASKCNRSKLHCTKPGRIYIFVCLYKQFDFFDFYVILCFAVL